MSSGLPLVLVADDDEAMRAKLQRFVESEFDAQVIAVEDGDQAWEVLQTREVQLVIADWSLPHRDGPELCRSLRSQRPHRRYTYFILLTADWAEEDLVQGMSSGADDYVRKPFDPLELKLRVKAGLRVGELERRLAAKNDQLEAALASQSTAVAAAGQVQRSLLPRAELIEEIRGACGLNFVYEYESCEGLGGDVLGLARKGDLVAVFLADVSGHGISASLLATSLHTYTDHSLRISIEPENVARHVARFCAEEFPSDVYASFVYLVVDTGSRRLKLLNAGHPPLLKVDGGGRVERLESQTGPFGLYGERSPPPRPAEFTLQPSTRLVLYTDGVVETRDPGSRFYSVERLEQALASAKDLPLAELPKQILADLSGWRGAGVSPEDDIAIAVLELAG